MTEIPLIEQDYPLSVSKAQALQLRKEVRRLMNRIPEDQKDKRARDAYDFVTEALWHPTPDNQETK
jgi:hypothetical protein